MRTGEDTAELSASKGATYTADTFRLPSDMAVRFFVLVLLLVAESMQIFEYILPPRGDVYGTTIAWCGVKTGAMNPAARSVDNAAFTRCIRPDAAEVTGSMIGGVALVIAVTGLLVWAQPRWQRWRWSLEPVTESTMPSVCAELAELVSVSGLDEPPRFLIDYYDLRPRAQAFGGFAQASVRLGVGMVALHDRDPRAFRGIVLHELAHIRNRDIGLTYLTVALWRAFILVLLVPWGLSLVDPGVLVGHPLGLIHSLGDVPVATLRAGSLTVLVYLSRNSVLRSRESHADVRAAGWDGSAADLLRRAESDRPARWRGWLRRWLAVHPAPARRLAVLADPRQMLRPSWGAMALTTLGAAAVVALVGTPFTLALAAVGMGPLDGVWPAVWNSAVLALLLAFPLAVTALRTSTGRSAPRRLDYLAALLAVLTGLVAGPLMQLGAVSGVFDSSVFDHPTGPAVVDLLAQAVLVVLIYSALRALCGRSIHIVLAAPTRRQRQGLVIMTAIIATGALIAANRLADTAFGAAPGAFTEADPELARAWDDNGGHTRVVAIFDIVDKLTTPADRQVDIPSQDCSTLLTATVQGARFPPIPDPDLEEEWMGLLAHTAQEAQDCLNDVDPRAVRQEIFQDVVEPYPRLIAGFIRLENS